MWIRRPSSKLTGAAGRLSGSFLALLAGLVLSQQAPLLDPSLVTTSHHVFIAGRYVRARGVRLRDGKVIVDVIGDDDRVLVDGEIPEDVMQHLQEAFTEQLGRVTPEVPHGLQALSDRWRVGEHDAAQCQADSSLSIVQEIRTGRFVHNLFEKLYVEAPNVWTRRGINLGAGIEEEDDDDPLMLWSKHLAERVVLVDQEAEHLDIAVRALGGRAEYIAVQEAITPRAIEDGHLGANMLQLVGPYIDVLKIDIDSFDCAVLRAALRHFDPALIVLESQPVFPPPFKFARQYQGVHEVGSAPHGCSLSYQLQMLSSTHQLIVYSEHDTVFLHKDLTPALEHMPQGSIFYWTNFVPQFPIDEVDCYRRARTTPHPQGLRRLLPVDFLREWALHLHPLDALPLIAGNLTSGVLRPCEHCSAGAVYTLDL